MDNYHIMIAGRELTFVANQEEAEKMFNLLVCDNAAMKNLDKNPLLVQTNTGKIVGRFNTQMGQINWY